MEKKSESIEKKLKYHFLVHSANEELLLERLLGDRRFGVAFEENDFEFVEYFAFSEFEKEIGHHTYPYTVRAYFNGDNPSLRRFREKRARLFPVVLCGNDNCSEYEKCVFSPESVFNQKLFSPDRKDKDYVIEYIWRCVARDEFDYTHDIN